MDFDENTFARMIERTNGDDAPRPEHQQQLRQRVLDAFDRAQTEDNRPTFLIRSQTTWRWMMRHPVSSVTAAAIFILAIAGVALWFHGGATPAFADFIQPILEAKTVKYKMTTERTGQSAGMAGMMGIPAETEKESRKLTTGIVMMLGAGRIRTETEVSNKCNTVHIWDAGLGKTLLLNPAEKRATVFNYAGMPKDKIPNGGDPVAGWRSLLLDARDKPDVKRESLGERDIDGCRVVGFRITLPGGVFSVWGDPKTGSPVRVESTVAIMPNAKMTMSDFEFNVNMDESLFSVEPPAGYEVTVVDRTATTATDDSPSAEKDLIEMFHYYSEWSGGRFPDLLETEWLLNTVFLEEWVNANLGQPSEAKRYQDQQESQAKFRRGIMFTVLLPKEADWHYAGKGVSLGATDTPVFWYRPKDSKKYRVLYADLSVQEADTPPSVLDANLENDLIEMFRQCSELSGGPFPDSLDVVSLLPILMMKSRSFTSQEQPQERSTKKEQEIAEARVRLMRGLRFINQLPKEANTHYAGKFVSLGAADTPIFWYRPKDSKKYRAIYADLSVRDADTPPNISEIPPEQDLIEAFREYGKLVDDDFPGSLDLQAMIGMVAEKFSAQVFLEMSVPGKEELWHRMRDLHSKLLRRTETPNKEEMAKLEEEMLNLVDWERLAPEKAELNREEKFKAMHALVQKLLEPKLSKVIAAAARFQRGLAFVLPLPPDADAHYAGKGVSFGAADTPIFWYRPKDAKNYRVTYADLSVREADTPPNVPDAQSVPAQPSPAK